MTKKQRIKYTMNNEPNNKLERMNMHEDNKRNAMLTKKRKKRGKEIKLQQGGCSSDQGVCRK